MRKVSFFIIFFQMLTVPLFAGGWYSVNIDLKTTAAMTAAYAAETATEMMNDEDVQKILDHYTNAEVSTAGIFASKWLDRKALQNAGLFGDAEENFYYKRIYTMVSAQIMPKILDVAALAVRNPEKAIYWGPYLFRTCEQVKQLCMTFETVVANGKVSFQDVAFLAINDNLKGLCDLTKRGEGDWTAVWEHVADFGVGLTKEDLEVDLEGLMTAGGAIVSGGGAVLDRAVVFRRALNERHPHPAGIRPDTIKHGSTTRDNCPTSSHETVEVIFQILLGEPVTEVSQMIPHGSPVHLTKFGKVEQSFQIDNTGFVVMPSGIIANLFCFFDDGNIFCNNPIYSATSQR